jgi:hypothetical protein
LAAPAETTAKRPSGKRKREGGWEKEKLVERGRSEGIKPE